jgi:methylated-DNA-[protein]-cysteine S-methyltransferase
MDTMMNANGKTGAAASGATPADDALLAAREAVAPVTLAGSLAGRAADEGLLDVAYAQVDSPLGPLLAATTPRGLVRLAYVDNDLDAVLDGLARRVSPRVLEAPSRLGKGRR